jgi:hypothetical protein
MPGDLTVIDTSKPGVTLLTDLEAYWQELRGARQIPARTEVDPARIDAALPYSFIIERIAPGIGRMRVAGQRIGEFLGMEARGMPLCAMFAGDSKDRIQGYLEQVFKLPALIELPITSTWSFGRPRLNGRLLLLPLLDTNGDVTRALGAIRVDGPTGRAPRAFELAEAGAVRIENVNDMPSKAGSLPAPVSAFSNPRLARLTGLSEPEAPRFAPPVPRQGERPYLRLVISND